jgi:hypothetical protein
MPCLLMAQCQIRKAWIGMVSANTRSTFFIVAGIAGTR